MDRVMLDSRFNLDYALLLPSSGYEMDGVVLEVGSIWVRLCCLLPSSGYSMHRVMLESRFNVGSALLLPANGYRRLSIFVCEVCRYFFLNSLLLRKRLGKAQ
jgi:hypothetical protein